MQKISELAEELYNSSGLWSKFLDIGLIFYA